tara:strand:- start:451 stop:588 length:138 start_codon:yes stop_codon:yes gene_type:complete
MKQQSYLVPATKTVKTHLSLLRKAKKFKATNITKRTAQNIKASGY